MARRPRTERQQQLDQALAALKAEKVLLKHQQARVAAARRVVDGLCRCDACGAKAFPAGADEELCFPCFRERLLARRQAARIAAA